MYTNHRCMTCGAQDEKMDTPQHSSEMADSSDALISEFANRERVPAEDREALVERMAKLE